MDAGGFATCADCRDYAWIGGDTDGLCAPCLAARAVPEPAVPEPTPEPAPLPPPEPPDPEPPRVADPEPPSEPLAAPRIIKVVRKAVLRRYEKGKLGAKPQRPEVLPLARALWEGLAKPDRDQLMLDLREKGYPNPDPFEAMVDYCEAVIRKKRLALKKAAKQITV